MGNVNSNVFYIDGGHPAPQSRKPYQYKYNYREWQDELDLNVTAMDFRQYDNALGRFLNPDRLSELAPGITPYRFAFNNPNYWSDPTGLFESQAAALAYMNENNLTGTVYQGEDGLYHLVTDVFDYVMSNGELIISAVGGGIEITIGGTGGSSGGGSGGGFSGGFGGGFGGFGSSGFGYGGNGGFDGVTTTGGGGYGGGSATPTSNIDWDRINTGITAFGFANGVKTGLIEYAGKAGELSNFTKNYLKFFKGAGIAGSIVTTGYSGYNVYQQYEQGGINEVLQHRDVWDASVGTVGLAATGAVYFGLISNPVGWAIGAGVLIYYGATLIYDAAND